LKIVNNLFTVGEFGRWGGDEMMAKYLAFGVAASLSFLAVGAHADPIQTLSFSGTLQNGFNGSSGPFGPANTSLDGDAYSITFSYNPTSFTQSFSSDSCGSAANASCSFNFTAANAPTETVTIAGHTQTFVGTGGSLQFTGGSHDDININVQGAGGLSFSGDFQGGTSLFANQSNVNNPDLESFSNVSLSSGTWNSSFGSTSFGANPTKLTADAPTVVPEPVSFALLGGGLGILGLMRRRKLG
jgi:hypothetical protein